MRKVLSILIAAMLVMAMIPCFAEAEKPTYVVTLKTNTLVTDYDDNYFTNWIEETNNCNLEFQFLPAESSDAKSKLNVMIAGGEYLGDILFVDGVAAKSDLAGYGDAMAIIDLKPYYDKYDTNLEKVSEEVGVDLLAAITTPDGAVWSYPRYIPEENNMTKYRAWINQTWLDNLGLEMPTTAEELYNVLTAFRDQDANGNGDPSDEIPMLGCTTGFSTDPTVYLTSAFLQWDDITYMNIDSEGAIYPAYVTDEYREALMWMNKLVEENLFASDSFSLEYTQYQEYLNTETPTVGVFFFTHIGAMETVSDNNKQYEYLPYLSDKNGEQHISFQPFDISGEQMWCITADCKDPDGAFQVLDSIFTVDGYIRSRFGVEGVHYDRVEDPDTLAKLLTDHDFVVLERENGWTKANNMSWHCNAGAFTGGSYMCQWNGDPTYYFYKRVVAVADMMEKAPKPGEYVPVLSYTAEELEEYNELYNNLYTYWKQCKTMFILGEMDVEKDWDTYLETLDKMGLTRFTELVQTAYDRQFGA